MTEAGPPQVFQLDEAIDVLGRTPKTLRALLDGLQGPWIDARENVESWSPFDVLGHLIHGEETDWIPRATIILEQGGSTSFTPFDRFGHVEASRGKTMSQLLDTFEQLRGLNLERLEAWELKQDQLDRTGSHPELGTVTLRELLSAWVVHDLGHIRQIVRGMAARYREAVGPWNRPDYLLILQPR